MVNARSGSRRLMQFVLKPTVFRYHRCPYCDLRQDYYRGMVAERKRMLPLAPGQRRRPNPGHMPLDLALRTIDEAAALGMEELQLSGGDPLLYPHLTEVIQAAKRHPGVFVLMNSVGTGVTIEKAREIIAAGLGAWNFSVDTLDPVLYEQLRGVRGDSGRLGGHLRRHHLLQRRGRAQGGRPAGVLRAVAGPARRELPRRRAHRRPGRPLRRLTACGGTAIRWKMGANNISEIISALKSCLDTAGRPANR